MEKEEFFENIKNTHNFIIDKIKENIDIAKKYGFDISGDIENYTINRDDNTISYINPNSKLQETHTIKFDDLFINFDELMVNQVKKLDKLYESEGGWFAFLSKLKDNN